MVMGIKFSWKTRGQLGRCWKMVGLDFEHGPDLWEGSKTVPKLETLEVFWIQL
jgi:hypothetical protein